MAIEEEEDAGIPEWVVTFGDMMSLLLTFFIMLVSMSEIKKDDQFQAMLASMRKQFGSFESSTMSSAPGSTTNNSNLQTITTLGAAQRRNTEEGGSDVEAIKGEENEVQTIRPGKHSTVGGVVYFDEDSAELSEGAQSDLLRIIPQIRGKPQKVEIRGHTSRKPVHRSDVVRDTWDLAYSRCYNTMQYLVANGVDEERIRLGSAGAYEPIDNGETVERRRLNARVEILLWDERVADLN